MSEILYHFPPCFTDVIARGDNTIALRKWQAFLKMKARSNEQIIMKNADVYQAKGDNPQSSQKTYKKFGIQKDMYTHHDDFETPNTREDKHINHEIEGHACALEKKSKSIAGMKNEMQNFENKLRH